VRSPIEVRVESALPADAQLPQEIERNAYFVASELLTNVAKHSAATLAVVRIAVRRIPETDESWLDVEVADDGHGGALRTEGHGLSGLEERLRGLGGVLELSSPVGGPTVAAGHLPLTIG
jgi:signal transduction histidine kinase